VTTSSITPLGDSSNQALLKALSDNLPPDVVGFVGLDEPPPHVKLLRLSRELMKFAEASFVTKERGGSLFVSPSAPATSLLGPKFSRLASCFEGLTIGDLAGIPAAELLDCAAPSDRLHMRLFIADKRELLEHVAAEVVRSHLTASRADGPSTSGIAVPAASDAIGEWRPSLAAPSMAGVAEPPASGLEGDVDVDLSHRFVSSDMINVTTRSVAFSSDAFLRAIEAECGNNFTRVRSINLGDCLISNKDYHKVYELLTGVPTLLPNLKCLQLINCSLLRGDAKDPCDACATTVALLKRCKDLHVVLVFNSCVNIDTKAFLFDCLDMSSLCRLVWLPAEWLDPHSCDDDEEDQDPAWWKLMPSSTPKNYRRRPWPARSWMHTMNTSQHGAGLSCLASGTSASLVTGSLSASAYY